MAEAPRKKRKLETTEADPKTLSKEERREAKRLKKAKQAEVEEPIKAATDNSNGQAQDRKAAKAARKAEKARRKAAKAALGEGTSEVKPGETTNLNGQNGSHAEPELEETPQDRAQRMKEARVRMIVSGIKQVSVKQRPDPPTAVPQAQREETTNGIANVKKSTTSTQGNGTAASMAQAPALPINEQVADSKPGRKKKPEVPTDDVDAEASTYATDPELSALPQTDIDSFLRLNHIHVEDPHPAMDPPLRPIVDFKYLPKSIRKPQKKLLHGYQTPTPVQASTWPHLLAQRDVIGVAETGSGKTLAFGLPCVQMVKNLEAGRKPRIRSIIVAPTRELASQIHVQLEQLAAAVGLNAVCVYGGISKDPQREALKQAHIVVATPGRLKDFAEDGTISLKHVKYLVLDEADRMLDVGFEKDITDIIFQCPKPARGRQTAMFTATWPDSVRKLASTFLVQPVRISIGADNPNNELRANKNVKQVVEVLEYLSKEGRLRELVREYSPSNKHNKAGMLDNRILIFCLYKKECARVEAMLRKSLSGAVKGIASIHGDMPQALRTAHIKEFKAGRIPVLVATDVASRGLDIPDVKIVINYTFPLTVEDYVHRIGRTGRAGKEGLSVTLFTTGDKDRAGALVNVLKAADQEVPKELMGFDLTVKKKEHEVYGKFYREPRAGEKTSGTMTVLE